MISPKVPAERVVFIFDKYPHRTVPLEKSTNVVGSQAQVLGEQGMTQGCNRRPRVAIGRTARIDEHIAFAVETH